jgi:hypothetical protein
VPETRGEPCGGMETLPGDVLQRRGSRLRLAECRGLASRFTSARGAPKRMATKSIVAQGKTVLEMINFR